jgi:hypothetical protein
MAFPFKFAFPQCRSAWDDPELLPLAVNFAAKGISLPPFGPFVHDNLRLS